MRGCLVLVVLFLCSASAQISNWNATWTTKLSTQDLVLTAGSMVCSYTEDEGILSWHSSSPTMRQRTTLTKAFSASVVKFCGGNSNDFILTSNENMFVAYFSDCLTHIYTSTDCISWTPMDNPVVFQSYSRDFGVYPGKSSLLQFSPGGDSRSLDLFVCPNMLTVTTKCVEHIVPQESTPYFQPSGVGSRVFYSSSQDGWYFWNFTALSYLGAQAGATPQFLLETPLNRSDNVEGYHFYEYNNMKTGKTGVFWHFTQEYNSSSNAYQYNTLLHETTDFKTWTVLQNFTNMEYVVSYFDSMTGTMLLSNQHNYGQCTSCPIFMQSTDGGKLFKGITYGNNEFKKAPRSIAMYPPSTFVGVNFGISDPSVIVVGGTTMNTDWEALIATDGPKTLYPILSLKNHSMIWGVQSVGNCGAQIWTSTDGFNWMKGPTLNNQSIPDRHAREFPPDSGNVVALVHNCNAEPEASGNYGDMWYFPGGVNGAPAIINKPVPPFPALFHAIGNGLDGQVVAVGFPYSDDDKPQTLADNAIWWGYSSDGQHWTIRNITSEIPNECRWSYPAGLELASNGETLMYNAEDTEVFCGTNSSGIPTMASWFSGDTRIGTMQGDPTTHAYLGGGDLGPYFTSVDGHSWDSIGITGNCPGRATDGYGPGIWMEDGIVITGGSECNICVILDYKPPLPSKLSATSLGVQCPHGSVNVQSTGMLVNGNKLTFVMSSEDYNDNGILTYTAEMKM